jgi:hypothetical protein
MISLSGSMCFLSGSLCYNKLRTYTESTEEAQSSTEDFFNTPGKGGFCDIQHAIFNLVLNTLIQNSKFKIETTLKSTSFATKAQRYKVAPRVS